MYLLSSIIKHGNVCDIWDFNSVGVPIIIELYIYIKVYRGRETIIYHSEEEEQLKKQN